MENRVGRYHAVSDWQELRNVYDVLSTDCRHRWVYRGQGCVSWKLRSGLERATLRFGRPLDDMLNIERFLLSEFKRHAHRYNPLLPAPGDTFRWFALMQHHGAPTRLLDFSYSFYVAAFFAIESAKPDDHCAVWAVDQEWCWARAKQQLSADLVAEIERDPTRGKTPDLQTKVLESQVCAVMPDNPYFIDERLAVQQGVFLVPLDVTKSFHYNLFGSDYPVDAPECVHKFEFCVTQKFLTQALCELRRMNISRVSLFPGLDGFAASLESGIAADIA